MMIEKKKIFVAILLTMHLCDAQGSGSAKSLISLILNEKRVLLWA